MNATNNYLSAEELAEIIGCRPNSYACMKRWLDKNNWPFVANIAGFPRVLRAFHDAVMTGKQPMGEGDGIIEPNFDALLGATAA